jgi:hypothetical protein
VIEPESSVAIATAARVTAVPATSRLSTGSTGRASLAHPQGLIAEAEGRHVEAVAKMMSAAEQCAVVAIPSWVAAVVDDLTGFTAVDDDARPRLREATDALRAGTMNVADVLSIVHATIRT